uniref:Cytochrome c oxidase subunit 3 n=1 Tax=Eupelmus sp. ZJUH_2016012 TaxID=2491156 RepID=A0A3Q8U9Z6_9HYME|nr:cytochrome c oxidase subunit 3 [Eupelmus sp. ZJUH_2016012]
MKKFFQPYHLVTLSPWPLLMSFSVLILLTGVLYWFNYYSLFLLYLGIILSIMVMFQWWRDVVRESMLQGFHTKIVIKGLKMGMLLFIISEILFFSSIFWCYLHMFLSPSIEIGSLWPPKNISTFNPMSIPLLNTVILLSSGISITYCHYALLSSKLNSSLISMFITIFLGVIFTYFQFLEYNEASFSISDSVYGSIFFMSTGFHGLHVFIGNLFLLVNLIRIWKNNFSSIHHYGFEAAAWYWHFVDVVWLFLFLLIYFWSS